MSRSRCLAVAIVCLFAVRGAGATLPPKPCDKPVTSAADLRVVESCKEATEPAPHESTTTLEAGGQISVIVEGLESYQRWYAKQPSPKAEEAPANLRLFLNDVELSSLTPVLPSEKHSHLTFDLDELRRNRERHKATLERWRTFLALGIRDTNMKLSVGFAGQKPLPSSLTVELRVIPVAWFSTWLAFAVALSIALYVAAKKSNILRIPGDEPALETGATIAKRKAFSLARTQMAAWFFVVLLAYTLIWLTTGALDSLTDTVLGLMGISAATALGATIVDTNGAPTSAAAAPTKGFWNDLISEGREATLPRLQILVWTAVLIVIFFRSVADTLQMPEFSPTLLGLMGISGGTYVGFKRPDQPAK